MGALPRNQLIQQVTTNQYNFTGQTQQSMSHGPEPQRPRSPLNPLQSSRLDAVQLGCKLDHSRYIAFPRPHQRSGAPPPPHASHRPLSGTTLAFPDGVQPRMPQWRSELWVAGAGQIFEFSGWDGGLLSGGSGETIRRQTPHCWDGMGWDGMGWPLSVAGPER